MANYSQTSFLGGMNMAVDDSRLSDDEYSFAMNVRNRFGELTPIKRPLVINTGFTANQRFQGIYTVGDFIILFQNGDAKYKHRLSNVWVTLWNASTEPTLRMSATADFIYVQAVPPGTCSFAYKAAGTSEQITLDTSATKLSKTVAAVVVQDGVNQPNLINFSSTEVSATITVRKAYTLTQHGTTLTDPITKEEAVQREYVPIGKQMMYFNGKLYIISPDGKAIYHSVSGRPLDFVVAINTDGNKISSVEDDHGASVVGYSISYEPITCIAPLNTESFFVSTRTASYAVTPDYTRTLFGEPMFTKKYLFGASVVNQYSFVDVLGDFAFIDTEGLRSFNAVQQLRNEGRNSAFSLKVAKLLGDVTQDTKISAAITFDNYAFFAVTTVFGHGVLVYDITLQKFVSFDNFTKDDDTTCAPIVQFTKIDSADTHELYAVTMHGELVKMWSGIKYSVAHMQTRAFSTGDSRVDQKPLFLKALFTDNKPIESVALQIPWSTSVGNLFHDGMGTGTVPVFQTPPTTSTSPITITVKAIPYTLAIGTVIRFYGYSAVSGYSIPNDLDDSLDGTFELTSAAAVGATSLVGKLTTKSFVHWNSPAYIKYDGGGTAYCTPISNGVLAQSVAAKTLPAPTFAGMDYTVNYPAIWNGENKLYSLMFNFQSGRTGWKISYTLKWDNAATLSIINVETQDITSKNSLMTQAYGS